MQGEAGKDRYCLDHFLVVTRVLHMTASKRRRGASSRTAGEEDCIYLKAEDEVMRGHAELAFEFKMENREDSDGLTNHALVMLVPAGAAASIVSGVRDAVGDEALRNQAPLD